MRAIELPCNVGDSIYYTTEWDKYGYQKDHITECDSIQIYKDETIFKTRYCDLLLSNYNKTWFTDKSKWEKECEILRRTYRYKKKLREGY